MKWIPVEKARKLKFNEPVFTKDKNGTSGLGKLIKKEQTGNEVVLYFSMACFSENYIEGMGEIVAQDITHVAFPGL